MMVNRIQFYYRDGGVNIVASVMRSLSFENICLRIETSIHLTSSARVELGIGVVFTVTF